MYIIAVLQCVCPSVRITSVSHRRHSIQCGADDTYFKSLNQPLHPAPRRFHYRYNYHILYVYIIYCISFGLTAVFFSTKSRFSVGRYIISYVYIQAMYYYYVTTVEGIRETFFFIIIITILLSKQVMRRLLRPGQI